jgi:hypothetical protein
MKTAEKAIGSVERGFDFKMKGLSAESFTEFINTPRRINHSLFAGIKRVTR